MIFKTNNFNDNVALIDEMGMKITYGMLNDFDEMIGRIVGERCLVFCMCTNSIGSVAGYRAFINNRIVPVMLNAHMEEELKLNLIDIYHPKYIWMPQNDANKQSFDNESSESDDYDSNTNGDEKADNNKYGEKVLEQYGYCLVKTNQEPQYELYDELCLMLTTSGSTGSPKFVRQSYTNVLDNAKSIIEYLKLDASERPISTLPMNYTYGLSIINSHLLVGATILLTDKGLMQKEFWSFFTQEEATSFGGVPYTYEMLERLRFYRRQLPSLRYMTQAGGKLTPQLHEKFAEYAKQMGVDFIVMYGQCEATARMGYLPADMADKKKGSMGIAIPGGKFKLIDLQGQNITEPDITGELVYEGKNVTLGYAECGEDLIKGDERGGILYTGDMALFDQDGYYYIVGRKKRFLKIYGNRVNLDEVDRMIKAEFDNIDVASSGVDDHMYIFLTDETKAEEVRQFVIYKTKLNPSAFKTVVLEDIPKNDSGKILYRELDKYIDK